MKTFEDSVYTQLHNERGIGAGATTNQFYPHPRDLRTLEIGFGQGELIRKLLELNNAAYGIDVGKASLEGAIKDGFIDKANLIWLDACHNKLPYLDNFFDVVYCLECIEHLESPAWMFQEVKRVLKPNGHFVLAFPRPEDNLGYGGGLHAHMYPGFLLKKSFRMFCDQMYFKFLRYMENGSSAWYLLENIKEESNMGVHRMIRGNVDREELYGKLREGAWHEMRDPEYKYNKQAIDIIGDPKKG